MPLTYVTGRNLKVSSAKMFATSTSHHGKTEQQTVEKHFGCSQKMCFFSKLFDGVQTDSRCLIKYVQWIITFQKEILLVQDRGIHRLATAKQGQELLLRR